jgi:hypothetical protein
MKKLLLLLLLFAGCGKATDGYIKVTCSGECSGYVQLDGVQRGFILTNGDYQTAVKADSIVLKACSISGSATVELYDYAWNKIGGKTAAAPDCAEVSR